MLFLCADEGIACEHEDQSTEILQIMLLDREREAVRDEEQQTEGRTIC